MKFQGEIFPIEELQAFLDIPDSQVVALLRAFLQFGVLPQHFFRETHPCILDGQPQALPLFCQGYFHLNLNADVFGSPMFHCVLYKGE